MQENSNKNLIPDCFGIFYDPHFGSCDECAVRDKCQREIRRKIETMGNDHFLRVRSQKLKECEQIIISGQMNKQHKVSREDSLNDLAYKIIDVCKEEGLFVLRRKIYTSIRYTDAKNNFVVFQGVNRNPQSISDFLCLGKIYENFDEVPKEIKKYLKNSTFRNMFRTNIKDEQTLRLAIKDIIKIRKKG